VKEARQDQLEEIVGVKKAQLILKHFA